jgi:hypothetical protein
MKSKFFRILGVVTVVAMLAATLTVAPALGLSAPNVALATGPVAAAPNNVAGVISNSNIYTITFTAGAAVPAGGKIVIVFPAGTKVSNLAGVPDVAITILPGIGGGLGAPPNTGVYAVTGTYPAAQTLTYILGALETIGAGSLVGITLGTTNGIINPSTAGSYTLTVATQTAGSVVIEAAATSVAYTIINPVLLPLPGLVSLYNPGSVLMWQGNTAGSVKLAVDMVVATGVTGYTIDLGPGTYSEAAPIVIGAGGAGVTIKASGAVADTIVPALWTVNAISVTFKGMTLKSNTLGVGAATVITTGAAADKFVVDGCTFIRSGDATSTGVETMISYGNTTALGVGTITNCTFDTTLAAVSDTIINVAGGAIGLTISKSTFKPDLTAAYASDYCIVTAANVTISENTFTGTSGFGYGVYVNGGIATINKNTFTGMFRVLNVNGAPAGAAFTSNTVTGCGSAITGLTAAALRVQAPGAGKVYVTNNTITGSKQYVAEVLNDETTFINFNTLTGNAYGMNNTDATPVGLNALNNWWGAATGPAAGHNTANVNAVPFLGAAPVNGLVALGCSNVDASASTAAGVQVDTSLAGLPYNVTLIGVSSYATNPGAVAPPSTLTVKKYFDVFVLDVVPAAGPPAVVPADTVLIRFYGTVTANSEVWFYSPLAGKWTKCSNQSPNVANGFVAVTITATTIPWKTDLGDTPFVLVDAPLAAPAGAALTQSPTLGSINVPVDTTFTWAAVPGAVSYEFEIAEEIGQIDKFYLKDASGSSTVSAYKLLEPLKFNKQYWWRVRAVPAVGTKSDWTVSFFTTAKEVVVVPPTPPVIVKETPAPEITLEIPPSPSPVQPIPSYLLWAVIGVGAVLVIAVIVLIVRTRRIS